jgi:hypothetical protein
MPIPQYHFTDLNVVVMMDQTIESLTPPSNLGVIEQQIIITTGLPESLGTYIVVDLY